MSLRPSRVPVAPLAGLLGLAVAVSVRAQTPAPGAAKAVIKPADNLVTDGLPEIPAEIAERGRPLHRVAVGGVSRPGTRRSARC